MNKKSGKSRLSRQILSRYVLTLLGFLAAVIFIFVVGLIVCSRISWDERSFLYRFLMFMLDTVYIWGSILVVGGTIYITYRFLSKPLEYLDNVVDAAKMLAASTDEAIVLPEALEDTQNELNLVRETAAKNAAAAKEAEKRKNDLIVYLAHDLKTPLTSVIGYLTLLRDEPDIPAAQRAKFTGIALNKAERLEELINEFFDITRFNLSSITLSYETINFSRMIEQISYEFEPVLREKSLRLVRDIAPGVTLRCDPDKLQRVFDNIFRNAANYSYEDTELKATVSIDGDFVKTKIENHGRTIPPDKLEQIFTQFFRLDASRGTSSGGAGLGLAIAREIVELHGGTISAESADETIIFTVLLPLGC